MISNGRPWRLTGTGILAAAMLSWASCATEADPPGDDEAAASPDRDASDSERDEISVVLAPAVPAAPSELRSAGDILHDRVVALGVEDVDVTVEGDRVVVEAAGTFDHDHLVEVVAADGELWFRPVLVVWPEGTSADDVELTPPEADEPDDEVILAGREPGMVYELGPVRATGEIIEGARVEMTHGRWDIPFTLRSGEAGIDRFNDIAALCFNGDSECPTGQLAMVIGSEVQSAPTVLEPALERDQVVLTGQFDEDEARDLALVLSHGPLPVALEVQEVVTP